MNIVKEKTKTILENQIDEIIKIIVEKESNQVLYH